MKTSSSLPSLLTVSAGVGYRAAVHNSSTQTTQSGGSSNPDVPVILVKTGNADGVRACQTTYFGGPDRNLHFSPNDPQAVQRPTHRADTDCVPVCCGFLIEVGGIISACFN